DEIIISRKATGTLVIDNLESGRNLYLIGTGTGLAPFLSVIKDPETYERFEKIVLLHGCRRVAELAYGEMITEKLPNDELRGDLVGGAETPERNPAHELLLPLHHVGLDQRRRHRIDGDAFLDEPRRVSSREAFEAGLRRIVMRPDRAGAARRARGDVDDASPFFRAHVRQHRPRDEEHGLQIHRDGFVKVLFREIVNAAGNGDAGVVDEDVNRAKPGRHLFD